MKKLTNQEIYDTVKTHLLLQNKKAGRKDACEYLTKDGLKCAVGCLIPEELYNSRIEGEGVRMVFISGMLPQVSEQSVSLLCDLQTIHDCFIARQWKEQLEGLAFKYSLEA